MIENPLRSRERTMGSLMGELKDRLGFVSQGISSQLVNPILRSFLQEANEYVFAELDSPLSEKRTVIKTVDGEKLYDFHNDEEDEDIDPEAVEGVYVYDTPTSLFTLKQGISEQLRCDDITRDFPRRYDILNGQLELFPTPNAVYDLVVIYKKGLSRFERDDDRPSVPSRLVFLYALASAKAHYNHKDAQTAGGIFKKMLAEYKSSQHMNKRYSACKKKVETGRYVLRTPDDKYFA